MIMTSLLSMDLRAGAYNLLVNCANLAPDETLVIISEEPGLGWYDRDVVEALEAEARAMGITPTMIEVGAPGNDKNRQVVEAVGSHDCALFLARIGDQDRFADPVPGKKTIMCYARDAAMLASSYGSADHRAFLQLKEAVNDILLGGDTIRMTCKLGTDISGSISKSDRETPGDVSVRRFPLGVPQPLDASEMSGRVALTHFLTPTGSKMYEPASVPIDDIVFAEVQDGVITGFDGEPENVENIQGHYKMVSQKFGIRDDNVHSFHAGIHPGCNYTSTAAADPDRWSNSVFTNPRVLHFHTCGDYAPGEICWMVIDHTLAVDGKNLWQDGRLCVEDFDLTRQCLEDWPQLKHMFEQPAMAIGLQDIGH
ncbi:MAG: hypothetical protein HOM79_09195 [Alphaproteobacteria bacterium]|jgi:hypothetical protein|nr:hypothetical protein [Alphaproteobacteria bacterium]MBT5161448.1 hypothetical protein [Alphaproteobacteria bacterium]